jgi:5-methylcytosine-specific restriction endonuclease McrA
MPRLRPRQPRIRLDPKAYEALCKLVLARDNWRCQECGSMKDLQVHHVKRRGRLGGDVAHNLITLCVICHRNLHHGRPKHLYG